MKYDSVDHLLKIVLVGDSGVGKTNILSRYTRDTFDINTRNTIGVDFSTSDLKIEEQMVKVQFWDTAGQEKYRAIASAYYKNAHGAIIVFDITNINSFNNVQDWLDELLNHGEENIQIAVFGNKSDLKEERKVSEEIIDSFMKDKNLFYAEISAKTNENKCVNDAIDHFLQNIFEKQQKQKILESQKRLRIGQTIQIKNAKKKLKCCR